MMGCHSEILHRPISRLLVCALILLFFYEFVLEIQTTNIRIRQHKILT